KVKVHLSSATLGVGPADRTGKSSTRCCPGGRRSVPSDGGRRVKPRVTMLCSLRFAREFTPETERGARCAIVYPEIDLRDQRLDGGVQDARSFFRIEADL